VYENRPNEFSVILDGKFEPQTSFNEIVPSGFVRFYFFRFLKEKIEREIRWACEMPKWRILLCPNDPRK
jgi:hypothetical protein